MGDMFGRMGFAAMGTMVTSLLPLIAAIAYVIRPTERRLLLMRPLSIAAAASAISCFAMGVAIVLRALAAVEGKPASVGAVLMGIAENWVPVFVSFGSLAAAWLLIAAGMLRRQP